MQLIQLSDAKIGRNDFFDVEMGLCEHSSLTESEFYSLFQPLSTFNRNIP